jgi:acyl carrier protein
MDELDRVRRILRDTLLIGARADRLDEQSRLLGGVPEFDSVAVVNVVMSIETEYGIKISDNELSADVFETLGSLGRFIASKTGGCISRGAH